MNRGPKPLIIDGKPVWIRGRTVYEIAGGNGEEEEEQTTDDLLEPDDEPDDDDTTSDDEPPAWLAGFEQTLMGKVTSEIDRRLNTRRQRTSSSQGTRTPAPPAGPSSSDVREARSVFRDELRDAGMKLSREERDFLNDTAGGVIAEQLKLDPDPDAAGTKAARIVLDRMKALRKSHQTTLIGRLTKTGVLDPEKLKQGPTNRPGSDQKQSTAEATTAAAAKALDMQAARGMTVPGQKT